MSLDKLRKAIKAAGLGASGMMLAENAYAEDCPAGTCKFGCDSTCKSGVCTTCESCASCSSCTSKSVAFEDPMVAEHHDGTDGVVPA